MTPTQRELLGTALFFIVPIVAMLVLRAWVGRQVRRDRRDYEAP